MKKLFLFALAVIMLGACSKSGTDDNSNPIPDPPSVDEISLDPTSLTLDFNSAKKTITVYSNSAWNLSGGDDWCKPSATTGKNYYTDVTFAVDENTDTKERNTKFTFTCGKELAELTVTQKNRTITTIHIPTKGALSTVLSNMGLNENNSISLKITGNLGDEDILTIRTLSKLEYLDLSELLNVTLPAKSFNALKLKYVMLPNALTTIPEFLFGNCESLKSVTIPSSVSKIEGRYYGNEYYGAFYNCTALTAITIPANIEIIPSCTFKGCKSLKTVTFEKGSKLKLIGGGCFSIPSSSFPNAPTWGTVGPCYYYGAFSDCTSLTSIEVPANVEIIETSAFYACESLKTLTFEKGSKLKTIIGGFVKYGDGTPDNPAHQWERGAFHGCKALTTIDFPVNIETIGSSTFRECTSLMTISFENGAKLKYIEERAFCVCPDLTTVDASACTQLESVGYATFWRTNLSLLKLGATTPPICEDDFDAINSYSVLKVPKGSVANYKKAVGWKNFASITEL